MSKEKQNSNQQLCPGLELGTVLQVQVKGLGSVLSTLVGMETGLHLIIKTPPLAEIAGKLYEKNLIIVRYFYAGQVFGFHCTLLSLIKEPFRLCMLSYPTAVETINLRKHDRIYCMIPAEIKLQQGLYEGLIEDISLGGCHFEFNTIADEKYPSIKIGDEALLILNLPEIKKTVVVNITVRTLHLDSQTMKLGVQFQKSTLADPDDDPLAVISDYIASLA